MSSRRARGAGLAAVFAVLAILGGVVVSSTPRCVVGCQPAAAAESAPLMKQAATGPAAIYLKPAPASVDVSPASKVLAVAATGTLTNVSLVDGYGQPVKGAISADGRSWHPTDRLAFGTTYTMTVAARGPDGMPSRQTSTFNTLTPNNLTQVYFETTDGGLLQDGGTFGVGMVVSARFDEAIADRAAAQRRLKVVTDPPVAGQWTWVDDYTAHWRPEKYYAPGTTVSVDANMFGAPLGPGLYGQGDARLSFRIGAAHVSVVDDKDKQVRVYDGGKLVRTMPTSMGKGGTQVVGDKTLHFWTPAGVYTVLNKAPSVVMDSSTYGLPVSMGYKTTIPFATKISVDGIYLHQLNDTIWAQGNTNVSHGCLNLSGENAEWFYNFSVPGDVVEVKGTGGPPLELWQNGDWSVPWAQWLKGSAL